MFGCYWTKLNETTSQPLFFSGVSFSLSMYCLYWLQAYLWLVLVLRSSGSLLQLRFCFLCLATFRSSFRVSGEERSSSVPSRRPLCTEICLCLKRDEKSCNTLCTVLQCPDFAIPWTISIREREKIIGRQRKKESFAFSCSKLSVRGHLKST